MRCLISWLLFGLLSYSQVGFASIEARYVNESLGPQSNGEGSFSSLHSLRFRKGFSEDNLKLEVAYNLNTDAKSVKGVCLKEGNHYVGLEKSFNFGDLKLYNFSRVYFGTSELAREDDLSAYLYIKNFFTYSLSQTSKMALNSIEAVKKYSNSQSQREKNNFVSVKELAISHSHSQSVSSYSGVYRTFSDKGKKADCGIVAVAFFDVTEKAWVSFGALTKGFEGRPESISLMTGAFVSFN